LFSYKKIFLSLFLSSSRIWKKYNTHHHHHHHHRKSYLLFINQ